MWIWWDRDGVVYYELLLTNVTITVEVYGQKLRRLEAKIQRRRLGRYRLIFHYDNASP